MGEMTDDLLAEEEHLAFSGTATFSDDGTYRYTLGRRWGHRPGYVAFIGLNPSTATAEVDDPTIRRCMGFARRLGYDAMEMLNLFAFRATDPRAMKAARHPVGSANDRHIVQVCRDADLVIAAWGAHGSYLARDEGVEKILPQRAWALGLTKDGAPRHPLYLPANAELVAWPEERW